MPFDTKEELVWERPPALLSLNPAGTVPILAEPDGMVICDSQPIVEYLEETNPQPPLIGSNPFERAEVRRLVGWFDWKFGREVTCILLGEKVGKRLAAGGPPDSAAIRAAKANLNTHLEYIAFLSDRRRWLAGDSFSLADIAATAHLSCIDYLGDIPWDRHAIAKEWYWRMKSRPSMRPVFSDVVKSVPPAPVYSELDF